MAIYLGIDGGGTKTSCVVADDESVLGIAMSGGSNITRLGEVRVREALHAAVGKACSAAKIDPARVESACVGLSGAGRGEVRDAISAMMREVIGGRIEVVTDLETTLEAAFGGGPGVITNAGTGSFAYGRNGQGRTARAGGWGLAISDEGSAQWIGRAAVSAVLNAHDAGDNPPLLATILSLWNLKSLDELVRHANGSPPPDFSSLFPAILEAAENPRPSGAWTGHPHADEERRSTADVTGRPTQGGPTPGGPSQECAADLESLPGDPVAEGVLRQAGLELGAIARNVIRRVFAGEGSVPVAMSGTVFRQSEVVRRIFYNNVIAEFPSAKIGSGIVDPVEGALALARKALAG